MFTKEQVQKAIAEIDGVLGRAKIIDPVLTRQDHLVLVQDIKIIQDICMDYFEETKDVGTDKPIISIEPGDQNI